VSTVERYLVTTGLGIAARLLVRLRRLLFRFPETIAGVGGLELALQLLAAGGPADNPSILASLGANIGCRNMIHSPLLIHNAVDSLANLVIGSQVHIGRDVLLDLANRITIEDRVAVSMRTTILTHTDMGRSPLSITHYRPTSAPVTLRMGCYVGANSTILEGVTIGSQAIVAAGAVVIDDVPDGAIVGGVPARPLSRHQSESKP
jgi:acetyltransferase-like isoleucine patch superfamily enzyme